MDLKRTVLLKQGKLHMMLHTFIGIMEWWLMCVYYLLYDFLSILLS